MSDQPLSDEGFDELFRQPRPEPGRETMVMEQAAPDGAPAGGPLSRLEARNVSAWFGTHKVLERVSLDMEPGSVTALIGPSGCGKSTFLRILNRMHEMIKGAELGGEVLLDGDDIYDRRERPTDVRKRIGMVFQKPNPFPAMSIYDNVASGLKLAGIKVGNKDEVVETSLRRAGLWNEVYRRLRTPGGSLSGGQQQRLCIARSLAVAPKVLLMDEPFGQLDNFTRETLQVEIAELWAALGTTIVFVTHDVDEAIFLSDRIVLFQPDPGRLTEVIDVDLPRPRTGYDVRAHQRAIELRAHIVSRLGVGTGAAR